MSVLGVVGAGTMGRGIAALGCVAGWRTLLHDPLADLDAARDAIARELTGGAERGRWPAGREALLAPTPTLEALARCDVVVEAAPERLELKRELFARLAVLAPDAVLATNTSSIPVSALGVGLPQVVGMHFFNPATRMALVEVVAGLDSADAAIARVVALAEAMGKRVVRASDGPGFLVNRCNRPFGLEALRCVTDGLADVATVDRIVRLGGGFPMGPFALQDLVGLEVSESFHAQSYGEPRWRPSPLSARMVSAGRLGRKAGRGWYAYPAGRPADPDRDPPEPGDGVGALVVVAGDLPLADALRELAGGASFNVREPEDAAGEVPALILDLGQGGEEPLQGAPQALLVAEGSLSELDAGGGAVGFHALVPLEAGGLVELTRSAGSTEAAARATDRFFATLGLRTEWVGDAPGLVLGRIVAQLVNEACFAVAEGVGAPADVDAGMVLGLNHPRGPLEWGDLLGLEHVLAILDALRSELGEERYRAAPLLRRAVAQGRPLRPDDGRVSRSGGQTART